MPNPLDIPKLKEAAERAIEFGRMAQPASDETLVEMAAREWFDNRHHMCKWDHPELGPGIAERTTYLKCARAVLAAVTAPIREAERKVITKAVSDSLYASLSAYDAGQLSDRGVVVGRLPVKLSEVILRAEEAIRDGGAL